MEWKSSPHSSSHYGANRRIREFPVVTRPFIYAEAWALHHHKLIQLLDRCDRMAHGLPAHDAPTGRHAAAGTRTQTIVTLPWQNEAAFILVTVRHLMRFFWNSTRGHRLAPWRSPYLRWRMETYSGLKMNEIGFLEFWGFLFRERKQLARFLNWTAEMDNYARPKPRNP